MALGDQLGLWGLIVGLFGIAAFYLWPTKKWIGYLSLIAAFGLVCVWGALEIKDYRAPKTVLVKPPAPVIAVPTSPPTYSPAKPAPLTKHVAQPSGFLQFDDPQVTKDYDTIFPGKQFGMNFRSRNGSSQRVLRAFAFTDVYILPATDQSDRVALDKFSPELELLRQKYASGEIAGPESAAGDHSIWGTILLHKSDGLTPTEAEGITSKRLRIYYVSWLAWTDLQNRMDWSDDCRWLQTPENSPYNGPLVWHFCQK